MTLTSSLKIKYSNWKELFDAYSNCETEEERQLLLSEIQIPLKNKKTRKLGKKISTKICMYLNI